MDTERIDVNVHPSKMEVRFHDQPGLYAFLEEQVRTALRRREMIPDVTLDNRKEKKRADEKKADEKKESPTVQTAQSQQAAQPAPAAETVQAQVVQEAASLEQTAPKKENVRETAASACEKAHKEAHKETHKEAGTVASDNGQKNAPAGSARENKGMEAASVRQQAPDAGLNISTETVAAAVPVEAAAERAAVPPPSRPKPEAPQPFETQRLGRMLQEEEGQYTCL